MVLKNQENKVINLYSVYSYDLNMRGNVNLVLHGGGEPRY